MALRLLLDLEFAKWAAKAGLSRDAIRIAANEIEKGLVDARLGGFLVKKRVGRANKGKSGGFRTIVAHREADRMIFLHGFAKSDAENITKQERLILSKLGDVYMEKSPADIAKMVDLKVIIEVDL